MPYGLEKSGSGYKVVTKAGPHKGHEHSNKPLPRKRALAQLAALHIHAGDEPHNPTGDEQRCGNVFWVEKYGKKIDAVGS